MASRRMFSLDICDSDAFVEMPPSAQALYFQLGLRADDDGFIDKVNRIVRDIGATKEDLQLLIDKRFILAFEGGVVCIKHWLINNDIRKDRKKATKYQDELATLNIKENGSYTEKKRLDNQVTTKCQPNDNQVTTKCQPNDRIGKDSIGKDSIGEDSIGEDSIGECENARAHEAQPEGLGEYQNVKLTEEELGRLQDDFPKDYKRLIDELSAKMKSEGSDYPDHYATIRRWADWERKKADRLPRGKPKKDDINDFMHSNDTEQEKELEQLFLAQAGKDRDKNT